MSAPDPKAWALTDADWERMVDIYGYWNSELPEAIQSVARRRAIEELKALHHGYVVCGSNILNELEDRIAAIEAEEA